MKIESQFLTASNGSLLNSDVVDLKAILLNSRGEEITSDVHWSIKNDTDQTIIGTFSNSEAKETTFEVSALAGQVYGQIIAECGGVTASFPIVVNAAPIGSVAIYTSTNTLSAGESAIIYAVALDTAGAPMSGMPAVNWTITPGGYGNYINVNSSTISFTANAVVGNITVNASVAGVMSNSIILGINSPAPGNRRYILSDAGVGPDLMTDLGLYGQNGGTTSVNTHMIGGGAPGDSASYQRIYFDNIEAWSGWFYNYGTGTYVPDTHVDVPVNLSGFTKLVIWLKSPTPNAAIQVEFATAAGYRKWMTGIGAWPPLTSSWQKYEMDISDLIAINPMVVVPVNIVFAQVDLVLQLGLPIPVPPEYIDYDYVYFEE
ncbi:hypothetical protein [Endomicrobium proavitum]|uniref:hypothetical protein n=1 Tax=Endomicrobium proavitum TaxID=1408281 RepID=UPI00118736E8|nr:hypothetical protein [Endomicrobium proavitum]